MNLNQQALNLFLYMYAMKDDVDGFKAILNRLEIKNITTLKNIKMCFKTACESNSKRVLNHILEDQIIDYLEAEEINKATLKAGHKYNTEIMSLLISNEKVLNKLTFNKNLLLSINRLNNEKAFELTKHLLEKGKYKISKDGDDIFHIAKNKANKNLIEYLFINNLEPGEQLHKKKVYEIMLTSHENISPLFLKLRKKLNIELNEEELVSLREEKSDLYHILEKRNLIEKLNENAIKELENEKTEPIKKLKRLK